MKKRREELVEVNKGPSCRGKRREKHLVEERGEEGEGGVQQKCLWLRTVNRGNEGEGVGKGVCCG